MLATQMMLTQMGQAGAAGGAGAGAGAGAANSSQQAILALQAKAAQPGMRAVGNYCVTIFGLDDGLKYFQVRLLSCAGSPDVNVLCVCRSC